MTDFYRDHHLDPAEWRELAAAFEKTNRPHRAAYTLEKLAHLQSIATQKLEFAQATP